MSIDIYDNVEDSRFELVEQGLTAYADYALNDGVLRIDYVYAPEALRGTGTAGRLMEGIAAFARERELEIVPVCGYAASWLKRRAAISEGS